MDQSFRRGLARSGAHFVALASFETPARPRKEPLSPRVGMRGAARIMVGRRTLIESIFEPLRQLRERVL